MEKEKVAQVFNENFKFAVNQELRHKGDSKSYSPDLGLLVLNRVIYESTDDDGNNQYERTYICRLVKFSGSGETAQFRENELLTVEEYDLKVMNDEAERSRRRTDIRQTQKEIYAAFGVSEEKYLRLKNEDGSVDDTRKFRACGWGIDTGSAYIYIREALMSADQKIESENIKITSPSQFEVIN